MNIDKIKRLYLDQGLSCREVGERLGITVWQVIGLMKKYNIKLRSRSETQKLQYEKRPLSFKLKVGLSVQGKMLHIAGHIIYWAEGNKISNGVVDLTNSNENMIKIFLKMLREIYEVDEKRLRVLVYCYANQEPKELIDFWSRKLDIPISQFNKPYIRRDYNPKKINKMPYGLVHIRYSDKKLFLQILKEIDIISSKLV